MLLYLIKNCVVWLLFSHGCLNRRWVFWAIFAAFNCVLMGQNCFILNNIHVNCWILLQPRCLTKKNGSSPTFSNIYFLLFEINRVEFDVISFNSLYYSLWESIHQWAFYRNCFFSGVWFTQLCQISIYLKKTLFGVQFF